MFVTCAEDRPLIVQFAANDTDSFVQAAKLVEPFCDGVDLNLGPPHKFAVCIGCSSVLIVRCPRVFVCAGCPQRAARTGLFGSYLLDEEHHERVFGILRAAVRSLRIPVIAKIRLLPTLSRTLAFCRGLRACGITVLAVHGRTRGFVEERRKGPADLQQVQAIVEAMCGPDASVSDAEAAAIKQAPLIVWTNGNVRCERDVSANLAFTSASGCMVGEALLSDPTLLARCGEAIGAACSSPAEVTLSVVELQRRLAVVDEYLQLLLHPPFDFRSPFDGTSNGSSAVPSPDAAAAADAADAGASAAAPLSLVPAASSIADAQWPTHLVSWVSFSSHVYRILNSDARARFMHHTQLADEFLDAHSLPLMHAVLAELTARMETGRAFDPQLQEQIDLQRAARQAARAAAEKKRLEQEQQTAGVPKQLNSKQRKRARWQQRKADSKRAKPAEGAADSVAAASAEEEEDAAAAADPAAAGTAEAAIAPSTGERNG